MGLTITSYCRIKNNSICINGNEVVIEKNTDPSLFLNEIYKFFNINYPKYHKMDTQCKLGLLCAEGALSNTAFLSKHQSDSIGIVLSNKASSLDTDQLYQNSINSIDNYFPSPSIFVYTLPNIIIGEIAIKHKITGENLFFVNDSFNAEQLVSQNQLLLNEPHVSSLISGWIDYENNLLNGLIYLVEKTDDSIKNVNFKPLNIKTLNQIYS